MVDLIDLMRYSRLGEALFTKIHLKSVVQNQVSTDECEEDHREDAWAVPEHIADEVFMAVRGGNSKSSDENAYESHDDEKVLRLLFKVIVNNVGRFVLVLGVVSADLMA